MDNIKQALIELIADFLDREDVQFEEAISGVKDPKPREETSLHIYMAEAAFEVYAKTVVSTPIPA